MPRPRILCRDREFYAETEDITPSDREHYAETEEMTHTIEEGMPGTDGRGNDAETGKMMPNAGPFY
jgi:hypothetical protein